MDAAAFWAAFDVPKQLEDLANAELDIAEAKERAQQSRRGLGEHVGAAGSGSRASRTMRLQELQGWGSSSRSSSRSAQDGRSVSSPTQNARPKPSSTHGSLAQATTPQARSTQDSAW